MLQQHPDPNDASYDALEQKATQQAKRILCLGDGKLPSSGPEDFEVKSLTPDICEVLSDVDYILDRRLPAGDAGRWSKDNYRWYIRGLKQGVCKVQAIVEGFEGAITQTFTIDAPPIRTVEIRQRVKDKPSSGSGGSGGSGFDYD